MVSRVAIAVALGASVAFALALAATPSRAPTGGSEAAVAPPSLATAERELILASAGTACGTLRASEPLASTAGYDVPDVGGCRMDGTWTPTGGILIAEPAPDGHQRLVVIDRDGSRVTLGVAGHHVLRPVAFTPDGGLTACVLRSARPFRRWLYQRRGDELVLWRTGACLPASAPDGTLAWVTQDERAATVVVHEPDGHDRTLARLAGRRIEAIAFTGDGATVVAVVRDDTRQWVYAISRTGEARPLTSVQSTDQDGPRIRAIPSPTGSMIAVLIDGSPGATVIDTASGAALWKRDTDGLGDATWSPAGDRLLIADGASWLYVEPRSGKVARIQPSQGRVPAWCCPGQALAVAAGS